MIARRRTVHVIHYEIFVRRTRDSSWTLDRAGEDRTAMMKEAELILQERQAIAPGAPMIALEPA